MSFNPLTAADRSHSPLSGWLDEGVPYDSHSTNIAELFLENKEQENADVGTGLMGDNPFLVDDYNIAASLFATSDEDSDETIEDAVPDAAPLELKDRFIEQREPSPPLPDLLFMQFNPSAVYCNAEGQNPLHIAAKHNYKNLFLPYVLFSRVPIYQKDVNGNTPLHIAVLSGHIDCVRPLMSLGAPFLECNNEGKNIAHLAAENGHEQFLINELWEFLSFKEGMDELAIVNSGQVNLGPAKNFFVQERAYHIKRLLPKWDYVSKVYFESITLQGQTARDLAYQNNHMNIVQRIDEFRSTLERAKQMFPGVCL